MSYLVNTNLPVGIGPETKVDLCCRLVDHLENRIDAEITKVYAFRIMQVILQDKGGRYEIGKTTEIVRIIKSNPELWRDLKPFLIPNLYCKRCNHVYWEHKRDSEKPDWSCGHEDCDCQHFQPKEY